MGSKTIKILAIDDNRDNLVTLRALIHEAFPSAHIFTAQDGRKGFELTIRENPDVIFLDIIMPGMDGYEVCRKLKADQELRDIPVVFLTALRGDKESRIKALESGAEAFLSKPVDEVELTAQLRAMLKIRTSNLQKRDEKKRLTEMVEEKTRKLRLSNSKALQLLESVKREQSLIRAIFDSIPGYLYVYDENGTIIRWNRQHETMTGYTQEELSNMTLDQWFDQEDLIRVKATVRDVFEKGYGEVEAHLILKDGSRMLTRSSGVPLEWNGRKYFTGIGLDITEQKRIEEELLESQSILKAAFENSQAGIAIADAPTGTLRYVNTAGLIIRGRPEEEIVHDIDIHRYVDRWNIFHLDGSPYCETEVPLARAILYGETCSEEFIIRRDTSEDRYVLANAAPIKDQNGDIKAGIVVFLDITDRKKFELKLNQNMEDLLASQRIAHLGTWRMDVASDEVVWSEELYRIFGLDCTSSPPPYSEHNKLFTAKSWETLSRAFELIRTAGIPYELELETIGSDGEHGWVWVRGEAVTDPTGTVISLWGIAQDISERKKNERDLLYLNTHDPLTGLYNRKYFEEELKRLDIPENYPLSLIMCDVNGLKLINDSFGHEVGDTLLRKAADTIMKACSRACVLARIGGDEFAVIIPRTSKVEASHTAIKMKELTTRVKVAHIDLSVSFGHDTKTTKTQNVIEVLSNAEDLMYKHKLYERASAKSRTIDLIMRTLFEKSNREAMHSSRVSHICKAIASKLDFNTDAVHQMRIAGLIHDIGKIGVDEKILNKPGRLTEEERHEVEKHPEIGWKILNSTSEFSELSQFVLNHHERWDGSGYPSGLSGESIPLEARIISIADAYDAMTSERSYKTGMSKEDAVKELNRCSGTQFDPEIVKVFVDQALSENNGFFVDSQDFSNSMKTSQSSPMWETEKE
ncbi:MAG: PAS domain S-box protein [Sphaerochaetaceae bacterium]|nr:PAS domain S-box protein [Sphaerochaetaceae bacterium]